MVWFDGSMWIGFAIGRFGLSRSTVHTPTMPTSSSSSFAPTPHATEINRFLDQHPWAVANEKADGKEGAYYFSGLKS